MSEFNMAAQLKRQLQGVLSDQPVTIETVTEEILNLKRDWAENTFYIGQRLNEAKELLPHGEWLPWLEGKVQFSQRTAQKFMLVARAYEGNPQMVAQLGSEKAFALLALPEEERVQIATEGAVVDGKAKPAADLTKRDIQKIVRDRKEPTAESKREDRGAVRANIWRPLMKGFWPLEGELVLLSCENFMGGIDYQLARCVGSYDDHYPFIDPNNNLSCEEFEKFDYWLSLVERRL